MRATTIALFIGLAAVLVAAEDAGDYEYEDEPAPPRKAVPAPAVLRGRSAPTIPGRANKIPPTPVKPPKASKPVESEAPPPDQEEQFDEESVEAPVDESSTEPPKKTIKPVVRPFRSNDDLLAALKRRRQQAQQQGTVVDRTSTHTPPVSEGPSSRGKTFNNLKTNNKRARTNPSPSPSPSEPTETPAKRPPPPSRKFAARTAKPAQPAQTEEESEQQEAAKPKFSRGSRRL